MHSENNNVTAKQATSKLIESNFVNCRLLRTSEFLANSRQKLKDGLKGLPDPTP